MSVAAPSQVRDAIVDEAGVSACGDVYHGGSSVGDHQPLPIWLSNISTLKAGDFSTT